MGSGQHQKPQASHQQQQPAYQPVYQPAPQQVIYQQVPPPVEPLYHDTSATLDTAYHTADCVSTGIYCTNQETCFVQ